MPFFREGFVFNSVSEPKTGGHKSRSRSSERQKDPEDFAEHRIPVPKQKW